MVHVFVINATIKEQLFIKDETPVMILSFDPGTCFMGVCALHSNGQIVDWTVWNKMDHIQDLVLTLDVWMSLIIEHCDDDKKQFTVVIERQPPRNRKTNRIVTILETYFYTAWKQNCTSIRTLHSNIKWTHVLKRRIPKTYKERKKECIRECVDVLQQKNETDEWKQYFQTSKKRDDLADAYLQAQYLTVDNNIGHVH